MTKAEIAEYLGFPRCYRVAPRLLEAMRDTPLPAPGDDKAAIRAFRDFLRGAGGPPGQHRLIAKPTVLGGYLPGSSPVHDRVLG